jgi:hypothetical protein
MHYYAVSRIIIWNCRLCADILLAQSGMVLIYKYMREIGLQNELIRYHCFSLQQTKLEKLLDLNKSRLMSMHLIY